MAYAWEAAKETYRAKLSIKSMGEPGQNAPKSSTIKAFNSTITYVDVGSLEGAVTESVLPSETTVAKSPTGGSSNAYILPWKANYAVRTRLGPNQTRFVTPNLNGCAIMLSGNIASPIVVHANCQPDIIDEDIPEYDPKKGIEAFNSAYGKFLEVYRLPVWSDVYLTLASKMIASAQILKDNLSILYPKDYLSTTVNVACVFGVRSGSNWSFYVNANKVTRKIWPNVDAYKVS